MKAFSKRVFLDYAATTPVDKEVFKVMKPYFSDKFANPIAFYKEGLKTGRAIDQARLIVAKITGVKKEEVIFVSSGTEADNLAITGVLAGLKKGGTSSNLFESWKGIKPHIISSEIEHPAILETCHNAQESEKAEVTFLKVTENGLVNLFDFRKSLKENTFLVSVMMVNNEIGTIQPIKDLSREIKKYKNKIGRSPHEPPYLHTDASQAPCFLNINLDRLGVDLMTLDGSKIYGPKGVGCLIKKSYVPMSSILFGGSQEFSLKPGTHNVPNIIGLAKALEIANQRKEKDSLEISILQKYFIEQMQKCFPGAVLNGSSKKRIPNNVNFCFPSLNSEFAVIQLDEAGVSCSAMSACKNTSDNASSYVVEALGKNCGQSSLRFSLGRTTRKKEIDFVLKALKEIINQSH